jgi:uncharacterized membrane protein YccC
LQAAVAASSAELEQAHKELADLQKSHKTLQDKFTNNFQAAKKIQARNKTVSEEKDALQVRTCSTLFDLDPAVRHSVQLLLMCLFCWCGGVGVLLPRPESGHERQVRAAGG